MFINIMHAQHNDPDDHYKCLINTWHTHQQKSRILDMMVASKENGGFQFLLPGVFFNSIQEMKGK